MQINRESIAKYYKTMQIETASDHKQLVMLHDKLFTLTRNAIILGKDGRRERLDKAQNIIAQLQIALKLNREDELTHSVFLLYDYIYVNLEGSDVTKYREALKVIEVLKDSFSELLKRK